MCIYVCAYIHTCVKYAPTCVWTICRRFYDPKIFIFHSFDIVSALDRQFVAFIDCFAFTFWSNIFLSFYFIILRLLVCLSMSLVTYVCVCLVNKTIYIIVFVYRRAAFLSAYMSVSTCIQVYIHIYLCAVEQTHNTSIQIHLYPSRPCPKMQSLLRLVISYLSKSETSLCLLYDMIYYLLRLICLNFSAQQSFSCLNY